MEALSVCAPGGCCKGQGRSTGSLCSVGVGMLPERDGWQVVGPMQLFLLPAAVRKAATLALHGVQHVGTLCSSMSVPSHLHPLCVIGATI